MKRMKGPFYVAKEGMDNYQKIKRLRRQSTILREREREIDRVRER